MKLYLVTDEGELLETWEEVEKEWLYSHANMKACAMEVKETIERLHTKTIQREGRA